MVHSKSYSSHQPFLLNDHCYYSYYAGKGVIRASTEKKEWSDDIVGDDNMMIMPQYHVIVDP
jgi:hypothetical protein